MNKATKSNKKERRDLITEYFMMYKNEKRKEKKMRNNKGLVGVEIVLVAFMGLIVTKGLIETSQNGVLKSNGQKILCKIQNKGAEYCDATYGIK